MGSLYYLDNSTYLFIVLAMLLAVFAQSKIDSTYNKYSKIPSNTFLTGREAARIILDRNNLSSVTINMVDGKLSDHYDPRNKTLNLSKHVYNSDSIAALSIAAHEVGHAIQDEVGYVPLKIRASIVPIANLGSRLSFFFIVMGIFFSRFLIQIGIALFFFAVLFQIVTLPVEIDASNRAKAELSDGILSAESLKGTNEVLNAAAFTYVASTLIAITQFIRLLGIYGRRR